MKNFSMCFSFAFLWSDRFYHLYMILVSRFFPTSESDLHAIRICWEIKSSDWSCAFFAAFFSIDFQSDSSCCVGCFFVIRSFCHDLHFHPLDSYLFNYYHMNDMTFHFFDWIGIFSTWYCIIIIETWKCREYNPFLSLEMIPCSSLFHNYIWIELYHCLVARSICVKNDFQWVILRNVYPFSCKKCVVTVETLLHFVTAVRTSRPPWTKTNFFSDRQYSFAMSITSLAWVLSLLISAFWNSLLRVFLLLIQRFLLDRIWYHLQSATGLFFFTYFYESRFSSNCIKFLAVTDTLVSRLVIYLRDVEKIIVMIE